MVSVDRLRLTKYVTRRIASRLSFLLRVRRHQERHPVLSIFYVSYLKGVSGPAVRWFGLTAKNTVDERLSGAEELAVADYSDSSNGALDYSPENGIATQECGDQDEIKIGLEIPATKALVRSDSK